MANIFFVQDNQTLCSKSTIWPLNDIFHCVRTSKIIIVFSDVFIKGKHVTKFVWKNCKQKHLPLRRPIGQHKCWITDITRENAYLDTLFFCSALFSKHSADKNTLSQRDFMICRYLLLSSDCCYICFSKVVLLQSWVLWKEQLNKEDRKSVV